MKNYINVALQSIDGYKLKTALPKKRSTSKYTLKSCTIKTPHLGQILLDEPGLAAQLLIVPRRAADLDALLVEVPGDVPVEHHPHVLRVKKSIILCLNHNRETSGVALFEFIVSTENHS